MRRSNTFCVAALVAAGGIGAAHAQDCNATRVVSPGDTVFSIAQETYGDHEKWSLIFLANQEVLEATTFKLEPGAELFIPCAPGQKPKATEAVVVPQEDVDVKLLTGSNYSPFTDRSWSNNGMVTELVTAAFESSPDPVTFSISWEDDWSKHLFPSLDDKSFDMGFPWYKPDCDKNRAHERCANFHFSDPLVDVLILLFVDQDRKFAFDTDADLEGKTLCRPAGFFTHDLERDGREWLSKELVDLVVADSSDECFDMLVAGTVDAVSVNVFLGATKIHEMGLRGKVVPLERPVSVQGLHVLISKQHWRGTTHLYRFNAGLAALKSSDRYNEIVSRHLALFWDRIQTN